MSGNIVSPEWLRYMAPENKPDLYWFKAVVLKLGDADGVWRFNVDHKATIWVEWDIRLTMIDAYEISGIERPLGLLGKEELERHIKVGDTVLVQSVKNKQDAFGRYLCRVFVSNLPFSLNLYLLQQGHGTVYERGGKKKREPEVRRLIKEKYTLLKEKGYINDKFIKKYKIEL